MLEDTSEKTRRILEECYRKTKPDYSVDKDSHVIIKPHSVYFKGGYPDDFDKRYFHECRGAISHISIWGDFSISRWAGSVGVSMSTSFIHTKFIKLEFDIDNRTIKSITARPNRTPLQDLCKFKPEIFKELYETIPEFIKSYGIYDYEASMENNVLTLNIITNALLRLEGKLKFWGLRFPNGYCICRPKNFTKLNDELSFTISLYKHMVLHIPTPENDRWKESNYFVQIKYDNIKETYSIRLTEPETGISQQAAGIQERHLDYTIEKMIKGEYTDEP